MRQLRVRPSSHTGKMPGMRDRSAEVNKGTGMMRRLFNLLAGLSLLSVPRCLRV